LLASLSGLHDIAHLYGNEPFLGRLDYRILGSCEGLLKADLGTPIRSEAGVKQNPIVVVVEDDILVRLTIVDYLAAHGCSVIEAASGEEAMAVIDGRDQQLDVLFTDIRLAGTLNGWDIAEIFRDRFPEIRVVYASGYSIEPRRDVSDSEFFGKPYEVRDILQACKR
jgi:CheY-like chemotaxis protein